MPPKTPEPVAPSFTAPENKTAVVLFPIDQANRAQVEELLIKSGIDQSTLPIIVDELDLKQLNPSHVLFTAIAVPGKVDLRKQPINFSLKISPPISIESFFKDLRVGFGAVLKEGEFIDEVQRHVNPLMAKVQADGKLKIGSV